MRSTAADPNREPALRKQVKGGAERNEKELFNYLEIVLHGFRTDWVCAGKCASVFFIPICEAWWCWAGFALVHQFINLICMREFSPLVCSLAFW